MSAFLKTPKSVSEKMKAKSAFSLASSVYKFLPGYKLFLLYRMFYINWKGQ